MPTEDREMSTNHDFCERDNLYNQWQGAPRIGNFDAVLTNYAIEADGHIDSLAVTNVDRFDRRGVAPHWQIATRYKWPSMTGPLVLTPMWKQAHGSDATEIMGGVKAICDERGTGSVRLVSTICRLLDRPLMVTSRGPTHGDKIYEGELA